MQVYSDWQKQYGYDDEEMEKYMPNVSSYEGFKTLLGPCSINISEEEQGKYAKVGYEFGCLWDDEHGFGAMVCGGEVVEIGGADVAF